MRSSSKAWLVLTGLIGFFSLALLGPGLSSAGDCTVRHLAQGGSGQSPQRYAKERVYAKAPALKKDFDCCAQCEQAWDYGLDRCEIKSQMATQCVATCGAK